MTYLLQVSTCWIFFFGIYLLFLRKETFFSINRYYLLGALAMGLLIPYLGGFIPENNTSVEVYQVMTQFTEVHVIPSATVIHEEQPFDWMKLLWIAYFLGAGVVFSRFAYGLYRIYTIFSDSIKTKKQNYTLVESDKYHLPFSFFHFIFISKQLPLNDAVEKVLQHEELHANQWHSIDIVFTELLQVFFWFNPILIFYKNALRQSHEYLADAYVTQNHNKNSYGQLLLQQSASGLEVALANQFFHSQIKNRITMMYKEKSKRSAMVKYLAAVPVLVGMLLIFSSSKMGEDYSKEELRKEFAALYYELDHTDNTSINNSIKWDNLLNKYITEDNFESVSSDLKEVAGEFGIFTKVGEKVKNQPYSFSHFIFALPPEKLDAFNENEEVKKTYQEVLSNFSKLFDDFSKYDIKVEANGTFSFPFTDKNTSDITTYFLSIHNLNRSVKLEVDPNAPSEKVALLLELAESNNVGVILSESITKDEDQTISVLPNGAYMQDGTPLTDKEIILIIEKVKTGEQLTIKTSKGSNWERINHLLKLATARDVKTIVETTKFTTTNFDGRPFTEWKWHEMWEKYKSTKGKVTVKAEANADGKIIYAEILNDKTTIDNKVILKDALRTAKQFEIEKGVNNAFGEIVFNLGKSEPHQGYTYYSEEDVFKFDNDINIGQQVPEGSIKVRVEDQILVENEDYTVDYDSGRLKLSDSYDSGKPVNITFEEKNGDPIFKVVEEMPRFPGCEEIEGDVKEKENCAKQKMLEFIYSNLKYPATARDQDVEGMVVIQFVIEKDGSITESKIVRDIGAGCGQESQRVVDSMPIWVPGKQKGEPVRVQYTLPVKFKLQGEKARSKPVSTVIVGHGTPNELAKKENLERKPETLVSKDLLAVCEEMPKFPGCATNSGSNLEKQECANNKMFEFIYTQIKYPAEARKNGIDGMAIIEFIVQKDGSLSDFRILRNPGFGTGEEALRVVSTMPKWIPGKQNGKKVKVKYNLGIKYKLEGDKKTNPLDSKANSISLDKLNDLKNIDAYIEDQCDVIEFRVVLANQKEDALVHNNLTSTFDKKTMAIIKQAKEGGFIIFEDIKRKCPKDEGKKSLSILLKIKDVNNLLEGKKSGIPLDGSDPERKIRLNSNYNGPDPLYVIDGKIQPSTKISEIAPDDIKSMHVLKGENATEKYGVKGKNGVIEITMKSDKKTKDYGYKTSLKYTADQFKQVNDISYILRDMGLKKESNKDVLSFTMVTVAEKEDAHIEKSNNGKFTSNIKKLISGAKANTRYFFENIKIDVNGKEENIGAVSILIVEGMPSLVKPLIIINDKVESSDWMNSINPEDIESMNVLKGEKLREKYGDTPHNSAVEITLKPGKKLTKYLIEGQLYDYKTYNTIDKDHIKTERPATKEEKFMRAIDYNLIVVEMKLGHGYNSAYFPETNTEDGSINALLKYVGENIKYPTSAITNNIEGTVVLRYTIEANGTLSNFKIQKSVGWGLDDAVIQMMENLSIEKGPWKPAYLDNKSIASTMVLPVKFKLQESHQKEAKSRRLIINDFTISPNPNDGRFNLKFDLEDDSDVQVYFYSLNGQILKSFGNVPNNYNDTIDLSQYSGQTVLINIVQNGKVYTDKVIIQ